MHVTHRAIDQRMFLHLNNKLRTLLGGCLQVSTDKKKKTPPSVIQSKKQDVSTPDVPVEGSDPVASAAPVITSVEPVQTTGVATRSRGAAAGTAGQTIS